MTNDETRIFKDDGKMKPVLIIPKEVMSPADMQRLRDNGICCVEAKDPSAVKFVDPIPSMAGRERVEQASVALSRKLLGKQFWSGCSTQNLSRGDIAKFYIDCLVDGTPLDPKGEVEDRIYSDTRAEEIRKMAREDARAERAAKKAETKTKA